MRLMLIRVLLISLALLAVVYILKVLWLRFQQKGGGEAGHFLAYLRRAFLEAALLQLTSDDVVSDEADGALSQQLRVAFRRNRLSRRLTTSFAKCPRPKQFLDRCGASAASLQATAAKLAGRDYHCARDAREICESLLLEGVVTIPRLAPSTVHTHTQRCEFFLLGSGDPHWLHERGPGDSASQT